MNVKKNKREGIEEKTIIEKFEKIYSNHINAKLTPKTIEEKPPNCISINEGENPNIYNKKNIDYKNLANYITRKSSSDIKIDNKELELDFDSQDDNKKNQIMKSLIESSKELLSKKILEKEFNNKKKIKEDNESIIIEDDDINNENNNQINEIKDTKENKYSDKVMKDIYKHVYKLSDNDNNIGEKKFDVSNPYERLYNQGFFTKNKSQINILDNIDKIKKNSNQKIISKNSQVLISKKKGKSNNKNNNISKYDKNNIYKQIKSNTKVKNIDLTFHPKINGKSVKMAKKMEDSFIRLTKPKYKETIETPKKTSINKEEYHKCIKRINSLYLDGVEKLQKKSKFKSCSSSPIQTKINSDEIENKCILKSNKCKRNKIRNIYYKQMQWKKRIMLENMKKKQEKEYLENYECSFRPQIIKRNISQLFKKDISCENEMSYKTNKSYFDIYFGPKQKEFNISKKRYFIINIDDDSYKYDNKTFLGNYKDKKEGKRENRYKYNQENIKLSLIQRKLYNLEKFFSKHNL